jgi:translation initiation factor IF-2
VEPKANPDRAAIGTVVEAELDRGRGPVATILVLTGTLRQGDAVVVGNAHGKARALEDSTGSRIKESGPATAAVLLGLSEVPEAGEVLRVVASEKVARAMVEEKKLAVATKSEATGHTTLEELYKQVQAGQTKELRIVLKSDVQGSLGAVVHALDQIQNDEVRFKVLLEGTGDINDNDVNLAVASDAVVVGFNVRIAGTAKRTATAEGVEVRLYDIIYKLTEDMEAALAGMLEPEIVETVQGRAEVRQIFSVGKSAQIAGSYVTDGRIVRGGARVYRNGQVIATDKISSVRRFKDDVREVTANLECGVALAGFHKFEELDVIESYTTETIARAVTW